MKYTIDAKGKVLGRIASEAAELLRGKRLASFAPNVLPEVTVEIVNASQISIAEKKLSQVTFRRYSGYPGGLKETSMREFLAKKGVSELLRKVVLRMLPRNTLRPRLIKRLVVRN